MSEYILFDVSLRDRFVKFVADQGLQCTTRPDRMEGYVVTLSDDLADAVTETIEDEYAALMDEQQDLVESAAASDTRGLMAISVTLADGQALAIHLPALYARRLYEHFTIDEIQELIGVIAQSIATPTTKSICCRD